MAGTQRTLLLLLLFVGTMLLAISLASGADSCSYNCDCTYKQACESGSKCCWSNNKCKKVDFNYDPYNCGHCNYKCPSNYKCCKGHCVNVKSDKYNCGSCGKVCKYSCKYGSCTSS